MAVCSPLLQIFHAFVLWRFIRLCTNWRNRVFLAIDGVPLPQRNPLLVEGNDHDCVLWNTKKNTITLKQPNA